MYIIIRLNMLIYNEFNFKDDSINHVSRIICIYITCNTVVIVPHSMGLTHTLRVSTNPLSLSFTPLGRPFVGGDVTLELVEEALEHLRVEQELRVDFATDNLLTSSIPTSPIPPSTLITPFAAFLWKEEDEHFVTQTSACSLAEAFLRRQATLHEVEDVDLTVAVLSTATILDFLASLHITIGLAV